MRLRLFAVRAFETARSSGREGFLDHRSRKERQTDQEDPGRPETYLQASGLNDVSVLSKTRYWRNLCRDKVAIGMNVHCDHRGSMIGKYWDEKWRKLARMASI